mmetsp:Transcript_4565/g.11761  ORF Transcript_4565/g.11761 Transcript_4565/m.11761 type:complete len:609 (-) Transcript_4565:816-2642(-)
MKFESVLAIVLFFLVEHNAAQSPSASIDPINTENKRSLLRGNVHESLLGSGAPAPMTRTATGLLHLKPKTRKRDRREHGTRNECLEWSQSSMECNIVGESISCPARSTLIHDGEEKTIVANITCSMEEIAIQKFTNMASEKEGRKLADKHCMAVDQATDCRCQKCPIGSSIGFSYTCTTEIVGSCKSFDCSAKCIEMTTIDTRKDNIFHRYDLTFQKPPKDPPVDPPGTSPGGDTALNPSEDQIPPGGDTALNPSEDQTPPGGDTAVNPSEVQTPQEPGGQDSSSFESPDYPTDAEASNDSESAPADDGSTTGFPTNEGQTTISTTESPVADPMVGSMNTAIPTTFFPTTFFPTTLFTTSGTQSTSMTTESPVEDPIPDSADEPTITNPTENPTTFFPTIERPNTSTPVLSPAEDPMVGSINTNGPTTFFPTTFFPTGDFQSTITTSESPAENPVGNPTASPTQQLKSDTPMESPNEIPTEPSNTPTEIRTELPTERSRTDTPTGSPTNKNIGSPKNPKETTTEPSIKPSFKPTAEPSQIPTAEPSTKPSKKPTAVPSAKPSKKPSPPPSPTPTYKPTPSPMILALDNLNQISKKVIRPSRRSNIFSF